MDISIIIPVYQVEQYIEECLQSVANQTFDGTMECIIVDDCGKDDSISIASSFINQYNGSIKFKIIYRENNGGLSAARNTGIKAAQAEYLYFLDSDDKITPNCMELMYGLIEKYGKVDLVQGSFYETDEEKKTISQLVFPEYTDDNRQIKSFLLKYDGYIVGAQSRLIKRDFIMKHNSYFKEGIIHEDNYWTFFLAKYVSQMCFCEKRTYFHRYNPNSITSNIDVQKETIAYKTIVKDCSAKIDSFLPGHQKELVLNNLITALKNGYYDDKQNFIKLFASCNTFFERCILKLYLATDKSILLHALIRFYKIKD